jgi:DNA repair protein RecO (recombination protein O)
MSEIIKTEAVVLNKLNYGDSSIISSLFTEDLGKISVIVKGARSPKSRFGRIVDLINHLSVVLYKKESREIQLLSSADILDYFPEIKTDLNRLRFAYSVTELVKNLLGEHEVNRKIFKGVIKILKRLEAGGEPPEVTFGRFFIFFLKEIGYEIQIDSCAICGNRDINEDCSYNFGKGLICGNCKKSVVDIFDIKLELLEYLKCLKCDESIKYVDNLMFQRAINFMENHLKYHVPDFKGIGSIKLFNERY